MMLKAVLICAPVAGARGAVRGRREGHEAVAANANMSGIGCDDFYSTGDAMLATVTAAECAAVATAMNKLDGVSNVTCHTVDTMREHYDHLLGNNGPAENNRDSENCNATASALNKLDATLKAVCVPGAWSAFGLPGVYVGVYVGVGPLNCATHPSADANCCPVAAARLAAILVGVEI